MVDLFYVWVQFFVVGDWYLGLKSFGGVDCSVVVNVFVVGVVIVLEVSEEYFGLGVCWL